MNCLKISLLGFCVLWFSLSPDLSAADVPNYFSDRELQLQNKKYEPSDNSSTNLLAQTVDLKELKRLKEEAKKKAEEEAKKKAEQDKGNKKNQSKFLEKIIDKVEKCNKNSKRISKFNETNDKNEKREVLDWINHQFIYRTTPYCYRNSYDRGAGILPELGNRCKSNRVLNDSMCYHKCNPDYHGIATVCWQNCQPSKVECAAGCADSAVDCAMATLNQVMSAAIVANAIYGRFAEAFPAVQKSVSEMSSFEKAMNRFSEALADFLNKHPDAVRAATSFNDLRKKSDQGGALYKAVIELTEEASKTSLSSMINVDDYVELVKVIEPGSEAYKSLTKAWTAHYINQAFIKAGFSIGKTLLGAVDETGIVYLVDSYAKPICTVPKKFPLGKRCPKS